MRSVLARIGAYFVEPERSDPALPDAAPPGARSASPSGSESVARSGFVPPAPRAQPATHAGFMPPTAGPSPDVEPPSMTSSASRAPSPSGPPATPPITAAAVLGAPGSVVPLAAACAGELRARARAGAALLCIWRPAPAAADPESPVPAAQSPAGATTPGARRTAARLAALELPATACGRLAWLALEHDPAAAAGQVRRCGAVTQVPIVLAVAGARPPAFEPLLADLDLAIAVLPADIDPALRELALATLPSADRAVLPPLPPGPPRWAAMAGLARLRSLPRGTS